jgi:5-oxoprolinase (ATP-hydrolysing)
MAHWAAHGGLSPGDVLMSNHPQLAGGSHLPDITVMTPVFAGGTTPVFWVASRGHHADVGGIAPGSMPPHSTRLADEGAAVVALRLVARGAFDEAGARAALRGSRALDDCVSDLRAQVAANTRGAALVQELVREAAPHGGLAQVHAYMGFVARAAEEVRAAAAIGQRRAERAPRQTRRERISRAKRAHFSRKASAFLARSAATGYRAGKWS